MVGMAEQQWQQYPNELMPPPLAAAAHGVARMCGLIMY